MAMTYGKFKREKSRTPSSSGAIKMAIAAQPHADLIPPPDPMIAENVRRAEVTNEAHQMFYQGHMAHEIIERYPEEKAWLAETLSKLEVVHRREQVQFVEGLDKPKLAFSTPAPKPATKPKETTLPLPPIAIERPKSIGLNVTIIDTDTGECEDKMVFFPRKFVHGYEISSWIVGERRKELEAEYRKKGFKNIQLDGFPR